MPPRCPNIQEFLDILKHKIALREKADHTYIDLVEENL